jgi:hypothetical protein
MTRRGKNKNKRKTVGKEHGLGLVGMGIGEGIIT